MSKAFKCPKRATVNATRLINDRRYYDIEPLIQNRLQCAPQFMRRLELEAVLEGHTGCVNCLEWHRNGRLLASASDDNRVFIWDPFKHKHVMEFLTPHSGNIFSVKFLPNTNDTSMITGAADCRIYCYDLNRPEMSPTWKCHCHFSRVKRLAVAPETPHVFWSSGEDGNILQFDIRQPHTCRSDDNVMLMGLQEHIGRTAEAKCIAINPRRPELIAVGANDVYARLYDRRMITLGRINYRAQNHYYMTPERDEETDEEQPPRERAIHLVPKRCVSYYCPGHLNKLKDKQSIFPNKAITYLTFSPDGTELLVNMGAEQIYLYDINNAEEPVFFKLPEFVKGQEVAESSSFRQKLPEKVEALKKMGNDFLENEKYLQAIYQYTAGINIIPKYPVFYLNRATAYMRRNWYGDVYAALRDCHTALRLDPSYIKAHFRMTRALLDLGCAQEANECLDELKARFPSHAENNGVVMLQKDIKSKMEQLKNDDTSQMDALVKLSEDEMFWRTQAKDYKERFVGHCNTTTDIKEANYFGYDGNYVIAGSDDGNFFIWERPTNMITNIYRGDMHIVNCVQPHPNICLLATSGIDHEVRLWSPQPEENFEAKNKVSYFDGTIQTNQQRMQADPFELNASNAICRSS